MREQRAGRRAALEAVAAVRRLWARLTRRNDDPGVSLSSLWVTLHVTLKDAQRGGSWLERVPSAPWARWTHAPASSMLPAPAVRRHQCIRWPVARHIVCKQPAPQHSLPRSRRRPHPPTALGQAVVLRRRRPWSLPLGEETPSFMYHAEWAVTVLVNCKTECLADCHDTSCTEGQAP